MGGEGSAGSELAAGMEIGLPEAVWTLSEAGGWSRKLPAASTRGAEGMLAHTDPAENEAGDAAVQTPS